VSGLSVPFLGTRARDSHGSSEITSSMSGKPALCANQKAGPTPWKSCAFAGLDVHLLSAWKYFPEDMCRKMVFIISLGRFSATRGSLEGG